MRPGALGRQLRGEHLIYWCYLDGSQQGGGGVALSEVRGVTLNIGSAGEYEVLYFGPAADRSATASLPAALSRAANSRGPGGPNGPLGTPPRTRWMSWIPSR